MLRRSLFLPRQAVKHNSSNNQHVSNRQLTSWVGKWFSVPKGTQNSVSYHILLPSFENNYLPVRFLHQQDLVNFILLEHLEPLLEGVPKQQKQEQQKLGKRLRVVVEVQEVEVAERMIFPVCLKVVGEVFY